MTTDSIKELVKRLQERDLTRVGESRLEAAKRRQLERDRAANAIKALQSEVERLKGVLGLIAVVDQGCGGNLTPMEQASSAMRQARSALEAKP